MLESKDMTSFCFEFMSYPPFNITDFEYLFANISKLTNLENLRIKIPYLIMQDSTNYFRGSYDHERVITSFPANAF